MTIGGRRRSSGIQENWEEQIPEMSTVITPYSSFSSGSSFEEKCPSPRSPRSSSGLRRSTFDLSEIGNAGHSWASGFRVNDSITGALRQDQTKQELAQTADGLDGLVEDAVFHYLTFLHSVLLVETGFGRLISEAQQHVGNVVGFLLHSIFAKNADQCSEQLIPSDMMHDDAINHASFVEPQPDPPLSPARLTRSASADSKGDWGHFADFQEDLGDEKSFLPSCIPKKSSLETLNEDDGYEGDADAFAF